MDMSWLGELLKKKDAAGVDAGAADGAGGAGAGGGSGGFGGGGNPFSGLFAAGAVAGGAKDTSSFGKQTPLMQQQSQMKTASEAPENIDSQPAPQGDRDMQLRALRQLAGQDEENPYA